MAYCISQDGRALRVVTPDNAYHHPTKRRVRLASVKTTLFHPNLPTLRHIERDNKMCKLPDEHCQTTTCCTERDFTYTQVNPLISPTLILHSLELTKTGEKIRDQYSHWKNIQDTVYEWAHFDAQDLLKMTRRPPSFDATNVEPYRLDGVMVKWSKPKMRDWRWNYIPGKNETKLVLPEIHEYQH
ncbi:testis, prostate and placenta-expressed protein-like [Physella acuta]|uniref:testis, prostate and placenta-expressed protein-like n=1 Tax=Physella acuta TaxID=109671 RepID=UPI0027DD1CD4|nr:testis, prostate and placenta-expressed protein-like [Physella acuta]XP_059143006.1 testis, prostate and placenta-expressed protein-like [Physella acuta]XP_059143007.1 testis, prostate and placenta-expressed protein-like [Physella acuta]XP_059143008.1 testis, prostate and placenta-expressed protein-like [Physella acuta]